MSLPTSKRFPIAFEMAPDTSPVEAAAAIEHPVVAVAKKNGWNVIAGDNRWVIEAGTSVRIRVDRSREAGGGILRITRTVRAGAVSPEEQAALLRNNARMAYAGFGVTGTGATANSVLVSSLLEDTADEEEIESAFRAIVTGGEWVVTKPVGELDHSRYKLAAPPGTSWEDESLRLALDGTGLACQSTGSHAVIVVRLDEGRKQTVHVFFDRADSTRRQIVQFISLCGPAKPEHYPAALASNATLALATVALAPVGSSEGLVVLRTQLAKTADREEILAAIMTVARIADRIESKISGGKDLQ